jgi:polysaccharide pyruvyl transferase WcaK-like protein
MYVYPDPAYGLEVGDPLKRSRGDSSKLVVGLNPIGFCDPRIWPRPDESIYLEYLGKLTRFAVWLLEQGYDLRVFTTENSVDHHVIEDLQARLLSRFSSETVRPVFRPASWGVTDVLEEMAEFDFVVTSKFHGLIFSHLLRKPVIALSYHRKMDVAMRGVGQEQFCAGIESFDLEWLLQAFRALIAQRSSIELKCSAAVEGYAARLSQQFDSLFLNDGKPGADPFFFRSMKVGASR